MATSLSKVGFQKEIHPMNSGKTVFSQLTDLLPWGEFRKCVQRYQGNYRVRALSCRDQYLAMAFGQLSARESLRDIVACLHCRPTLLYHMGFRGRIRRSTLADANEKRDWRIYHDFAVFLIEEARSLYQNETLAVDLDNLVYAVDSTTITLCLSVFSWARYKRTVGGIKLHTVLDLRGSIPSFIHITDGAVHDVKFLDELIIEQGAFYVMDRGYLDYERLFNIHREGAFFVTRSRKSFQFRRLYSNPVDKATGLRCDQTVVLVSFYPKKKYPEKLRRIKYYDKKQEKTLVFLTNNFDLEPLIIAELYRQRWQVELFFRWIKQHLRLRAFFGTSENAVRTQVWIAISVYVLVAIAKKHLKTDHTLYEILQILSLALFEKVTLAELVTSTEKQDKNTKSHNQLELFDF